MAKEPEQQAAVTNESTMPAKPTRPSRYHPIPGAARPSISSSGRPPAAARIKHSPSHRRTGGLFTCTGTGTGTGVKESQRWLSSFWGLRKLSANRSEASHPHGTPLSHVPPLSIISFFYSFILLSPIPSLAVKPETPSLLIRIHRVRSMPILGVSLHLFPCTVSQSAPLFRLDLVNRLAKPCQKKKKN